MLIIIMWIDSGLIQECTNISQHNNWILIAASVPSLVESLNLKYLVHHYESSVKS